MHLKYTKIVNKKGQAVLVGCDRAGSYVNPQFVFIYTYNTLNVYIIMLITKIYMNILWIVLLYE